LTGKRLGRGNGRPCAGLLANGQPCNSRAWKTGKLCLHCSEKEAALLAHRFQSDDQERVEVTLELPAVGDLRYAPREELLALMLFLQASQPRITMPVAKAAA